MKITNFDLERWYVKYEFSSKYNLSTSGIRPLNLKNLDVDDSFKGITLTYSPANGKQELVEIIAKINNVNPGNILVTNGAIEAIFLSQMFLINPGDKVIAVKPTYPALYQVAEDLGAEIIDWNLEFSKNFKPDLEKLKILFETHQPKMLVINFPNNPTGTKISTEELKQICLLCEKHNTFLLSDEVYKGINNREEQENNIESAFNIYNKSISINSLSKIYGFPGLRIGWMIADEAIIDRCMNLRHYTSLCNNVLGEIFAVNILKNKEKYIQDSNVHAKDNLSILLPKLEKWKSEFNLDYVIPESGVMLFIKMNALENTEQFCVDFEKETSILLLPGNKYGRNYKQFFRLGFGGNTESLIYCLDKLELFLQNYKKYPVQN